jgi:hypothetical protein
VPSARFASCAWVVLSIKGWMPQKSTLSVSPRPPRIDPELKALIAPLTREERNQLEANITAEGCRDALVVWNGTLLDGHHRLEICTRLRIPYRTSAIALPNREAAKLWIEENQIGRRNLSPDQRAAIAYRILQRRVAISKHERARKGGLAGGNGRPKLCLMRSSRNACPASKTGQRERTAAQLGISSRQIRSVSEIAKRSMRLLEQIVAGTLTIKKAKEQLVEASRNAKRIPSFGLLSKSPE